MFTKAHQLQSCLISRTDSDDEVYMKTTSEGNFLIIESVKGNYRYEIPLRKYKGRIKKRETMEELKERLMKDQKPNEQNTHPCNSKGSDTSS